MTMEGAAHAQVTELRRGIHRIEKGLIMQPRRIPFGRAIVPEVVDRLRRLDAGGVLPVEDRAWAIGVLVEYFKVHAEVDEPWLHAARSCFRVGDDQTGQVQLAPAPRSSYARSSVTLDELRGLARRRRSVRWFSPQLVEPAVVDAALDVAREAPSACNRQNVRFHLIYGCDATEPVLATAGGTRGFSHQVPCVAVVIGSLAGYRHAFDRHAIFVDGGLASMGLLLALESQGLSSCCINWPDQSSRYRDLQRYVPLGRDEQVIMLIAIGYADQEGLIPSSHKRSLEVLRSRHGET
ncbi:nitroreductase family protein [Geodermatophilus sp. SYSU D00965]